MILERKYRSTEPSPWQRDIYLHRLTVPAPPSPKHNISLIVYLNQLNSCHLSVITTTLLDLSLNAAVSSIAVVIAGRYLLKERLYQILVVHKCKSLATSVERAVLSKSDHMVNVLADGLGTGLQRIGGVMLVV